MRFASIHAAAFWISASLISVATPEMTYLNSLIFSGRFFLKTVSDCSRAQGSVAVTWISPIFEIANRLFCCLSSVHLMRTVPFATKNLMSSSLITAFFVASLNAFSKVLGCLKANFARFWSSDLR